MEAMSPYEELKQKNKDLEILTNLIQAVHKSSSLEETYGVALDSVVDLENVNMAMIYLVDEEKHEAVLQAHRNLPEDYVRRAGRIPYPKGITWKVINTGRILNVEDAQKDPDTGPAGRDLGHHSNLGIPIFLEEKVIGVIWFGSYKEHKFNQREIDLLSTLGDQIAIAISRAKQTEELEERNRNLSILSAISQAVHQSVDLDQVYRTVLDVTKDLRFIDIVSVYLVEGEGDKREAVLQVHRGYTEEYLKRASRIPYPRGNTWNVIESGESVYYEDASDPSTPIGPAGKALGKRSLLSIPIKSGDETIGVIAFSSFTKRRFSKQELNVLLSLGNQIGTAIAKAKMFKEIKQREEALQESEERFSLFMHNLPGVAFMKDIQGRYIYVNETLEKILCRERSDWFGKTDDEIWPSATATQFKENDRIVIESRKALQVIETTLHEDEIHYWLVSKFPILNKNETPVILGGVAVDITERRRAEEALRESERRYRLLAENATDNIWTMDMNLRYTYVSPSVTRMRGYSVEEAMAQTVDEALTPSSLEVAMKAFMEELAIESMEQKDLLRSRTLDLELKCKDGSTIWTEIKMTFLRDHDNRPVGILGVTRDITERKRAEEALRETLAQLSKKSRYETIISTVTQNVHKSINLQEVLENAVEAMSQNMDKVDNVSIYLVEGEDFGELSRAEAVMKAHRGYPDWFIKRVGRIPYPKDFTWKTIMDQKPIYCRDIDEDTIVGRVGREIGVKSYLSMPIHYEGKTVGVININSLKKSAFDEEELKLLEIIAQQMEIAINNAQQTETLRWSEERYRTLFDQSPIGVYIFDKEFKITQCNERMVQILQSSYDKIIGLDMRNLKDQGFMPAMEKVFEGQFSHQESFYEATTSPAKLWLSIRFSPLRDANGNIVGGMGVVEDVTKRKWAEEKVQQYAKQLQTLSHRLLEAQEVERHNLARELHDEIGQILTLVKINLQTMQSLDENHRYTSRLKESIAIIDRALEQVRNLSFDLRPSMLDDLGLVAALRSHLYGQAQRAGFIVKFAASPLRMHRLPQDLEIVCFRIVQEALTNVTRHAQAKHVQVKLRKRKRELELVIRDDGVGFDVPAAQERAACGASFGLVGMRERVQLVGGQIEIKSKPKHGTTIHVCFPLTPPLSPKAR